MKVNRLVACTALCVLAACSNEEPTGEPAAVVANSPTLVKAEPSAPIVDLATRAGAPLFEGMGDHHHPISTADPDAQRYFDQGLVIDFAFNHAESARSFRAAQTLDSECAMCYWGEALALGPNINVTSNGVVVMGDDDRRQAYAAIQKAVALKDRATPAEQDYIDALATRYDGNLESPRVPLDLAYVNAMRALYEKYPDDDDAAALFAESMMNTMPWDYWLDDDNPKPLTVEVLSALETVLARSPDHPLAIHLYIHAVEASGSPARAEAAADRLRYLVPAAGHLVHMPSHIYWRVGRYADASEVNVRAAAVDEAYIAACNAQGFYPAAYYPHNIHFLWASSSMEGRSKVALEAARKVADNVRLEMIEEFPAVEFFHTIPLLSLVQFGQWDTILSEPTPPVTLEYSTAIWHYARAVALARKGDLQSARLEQQKLTQLREVTDVVFLDSIYYPATMLLEIADSLALGEIAAGSGDFKTAIALFENAVMVQDELPYTEPPFWYYPTRHTLGKALLAAGRPAEAELVYQRDLELYPRNGWAMFGLIQSLAAQEKDTSRVQARFDTTWAQADVMLTASQF
jgi:tetratricopeptide (TPR) repeat protein